MAIFCEKCEKFHCCDFCINYNFNGDEKGGYTGNGKCEHFNEQRDPSDGDGCEEYICEFVCKDQ